MSNTKHAKWWQKLDTKHANGRNSAKGLCFYIYIYIYRFTLIRSSCLVVIPRLFSSPFLFLKFVVASVLVFVMCQLLVSELIVIHHFLNANYQMPISREELQINQRKILLEEFFYNISHNQFHYFHPFTRRSQL